MTTVDVKEQFRTIVARVSTKLTTRLQQIDPMITGVHYLYGHITDIQDRLILFSKTEKRTDRYPLVVVFEDDPVDHNSEGIYGTATMQVLILTTTSKTHTREQRRDITFNPILVPIYEELLNQIWMSGYYMVYSTDQIQHRQINRPHWGDPKLYKNEGYLLTDVLDGIELSRLQLKPYLQTC